MRKRYSNLDQVENTKSTRDMLCWMKERRTKVKDLSVSIPQADVKQLDAIKLNDHQLSYTWIGHSTFLIQLNGLNILTDPVWAYRMGLQRRLTEPGFTLKELPPIDIVVISHGHYDHLDFPTLRKLKGNPLYAVPVGMKRTFIRKGMSNVVEFVWWEHFVYKGVQIEFVPAQHWTKRSLFDTNTSHWGGWILQAQGQTLYFVGDTGYFRGFRDIAKRYNINTVFMPIGAYEPEWFMKVSHINPEDAVRAYVELGAHTFVPMHYGAYRLADDTGPEALSRLYQAWEKLRLPSDRLKVLAIGETVFADRTI